VDGGNQFECASCRHQSRHGGHGCFTTPTFFALEVFPGRLQMVESKKGMTRTSSSGMLGVSYKTAWTSCTGQSFGHDCC